MNPEKFIAIDIETVKPFPQGENWRDPPAARDLCYRNGDGGRRDPMVCRRR